MRPFLPASPLKAISAGRLIPLLLSVLYSGSLTAAELTVEVPETLSQNPVFTRPVVREYGNLTSAQLAAEAGRRTISFDQKKVFTAGATLKKVRIAIPETARCPTVTFAAPNPNWFMLIPETKGSGQALGLRGLPAKDAALDFHFNRAQQTVAFTLDNLLNDDTAAPDKVRFYADAAGRVLLAEYVLTGGGPGNRQGQRLFIAHQNKKQGIGKVEFRFDVPNRKIDFQRYLDDLSLIPLPQEHRAAAAPNLALPPEAAAWDDAEKEEQVEAAQKLLAELKNAIAAGKKEFTVAPGNYRFDKSLNPRFELKKADNLTIKADGATFWFDGSQRFSSGIMIRDCRNLTIKGLTVDYDPLTATQGVITAIDTVARSMNVKIDPGFPLPDRNWFRKKGSIKAAFFDPQGEFIPVRQDWVGEIACRDDATVTVKFMYGFPFQYDTAIKVGDRLAFPERSRGHAIAVSGADITLDGVTVYAAPDMTISETGGDGNHRYVNCKFIRRPGTGRLIASNADVYHSVKVKKGATIENCEFSYACDDFINIHGFWSVVQEVLSPTEIIALVHFGREDWTGEELDFFDFARFAARGKAKVVAMQELDDKKLIEAGKQIPAAMRKLGHEIVEFHPRNIYPCRVKLDRPLPLRKYDLIQSYSHTGSGAVIRNNYFHHTFARGILARGGDALIENNRLEHTGGPAIHMSPESYCIESAGVRNTVVSNNILKDNCFRLDSRLWENTSRGAIILSSSAKSHRHPAGAILNRNVIISDNTIIDSGSNGILVDGAEDCKITGNTVTAPFHRPIPKEAEAAVLATAYGIYITDSRNIEVKNNRLEKPDRQCRGLIGYGPTAVDCGPQGIKK